MENKTELYLPMWMDPFHVGHSWHSVASLHSTRLTWEERYQAFYPLYRFTAAFALPVVGQQTDMAEQYCCETQQG